MNDTYRICYDDGTYAAFNCCEGWTRHLEAGGEKAVTRYPMGGISSFAGHFHFAAVLLWSVTFCHVWACSDILHDFHNSAIEECLMNVLTRRTKWGDI
jgi:hypothetical protein